MKFIFLITALILVPNLCFAQNSNDERSKCITKESIADSHARFKIELTRFMKKDNDLSQSQKVHVMKKSLDLVLGRMNKISQLTSIKPTNQALVKDAIRLHDDMLENKVTETEVFVLLTKGLPKLSDELDGMLKKAQEQDPKCKIIINQPVRTGNNNQNSGQGSR